ncbi:succinylglutamate desuccinylase/aspartoacylase family protein [Natrononativus amylolyticus]|uniref:succinylglutamate desuccinylase/aspartoacylase family protein n=1 Tax=Natrononativus amylolyticus TaxID=2963434 RepID=UPI0020CD01AF|nr:succinylglutamate desuccinylase/aspartoacylase family protein [Natrononativus amylolyticus]
MTLTVGTASVGAGERTEGYLEVTDLPTGGVERLPVVLARGEEDGPTLWITGGVHGNEMTGIAAAQDVLAEGVPEGLCGTVVCVPMCNPAGIRRVERTSYYHGDDPNRYFPTADTESPTRRRVQELIDERLYDEIVDSADALLDLHTAQAGSVPFVIRDRVLYGRRRDEDEARELAARLESLAEATEVPIVTEYPSDEYADRNLHRSTAGAVLNEAGIPALTLELGGHDAVEEAYRAAGVAAAYRAMVHLDMLEAVPERIERDAPPLESPVDFPVRRFVGPQTPRAGVCRHRLAAGESFAAGEELAAVVSPHGDVLETLSTDHDGYVLGRRSPVVYENDPVYSLAVRDEGELLASRE